MRLELAMVVRACHLANDLGRKVVVVVVFGSCSLVKDRQNKANVSPA